MASALFTIDQVGAPAGTPGRARRDAVVGALVTLTADDLTATTYSYELYSEPDLATTPITDSTLPVATFTPVNAGGYLIRLTVDAGLATEDVSMLYMGISLPGSAHCVPAAFETNQDNSVIIGGTAGWSDKREALDKYLDLHCVFPTKVYTGSGAVSADDSGHTIKVDGPGYSLALPDPPVQGQQYVFSADTDGFEITCTAADFRGPWYASQGSWSTMELAAGATVKLVAQEDPTGTLCWFAVSGDGYVLSSADPTHYWTFSAAEVGTDIITGVEEYWIDGTNGTVGGTGSLSDPVQTIEQAIALVQAPTGAPDFRRVVVFHIASGNYTPVPPLTLPGYRWAYVFLLTSAYVTAPIAWEIDVAQRWGASLTTYPWTCIIRGLGGAIISGVTVRNVNTTDPAVNGTKNLAIYDCTVNGDILNAASGDPTYPTGNTRLSLFNCSMGGTHYITGENEHTGLPTRVRNTLYLATQNSAILATILGDVMVSACYDTIFKDFGEAIASWGIIEGDTSDFPGFSGCTFTGRLYFGSDDPVFYTCSRPIYFDSQSYSSAVSTTLVFRNMTPGTPDYVLTDTAEGVGVDSSAFVGNLVSLSPGPTDVQACLDVIDGMVADTGELGPDAIYVDASRGTPGGTGTFGDPVQTLAEAFALVGVPANVAEYATPVVFYLAPGTYAGVGVELPRRQYVTITGNQYLITASFEMNLYGEDVDPLELRSYPRRLVFASAGKNCELRGSLTKTRVGDLAKGLRPSNDSVYFLQGVIASPTVTVAVSGAGVVERNSGALNVIYMTTSNNAGVTHRMGGTFEAVTSELNPVNLYSYSSRLDKSLTLCGVSNCADILSSIFLIRMDYTTDTASAPYTGRIGGVGTCGFSGGYVAPDAPTVGWNGMVPSIPGSFQGDSQAVANMATWTVNNMGAVLDFEGPTYYARRNDTLNGIGGFPADSVVIARQIRSTTVPGTFDGAELVADYAVAKALNPAGGVPTDQRRVTLYVPSGVYSMGTDTWTLDASYVDIVALSSPEIASSNSSIPTVLLVGAPAGTALVSQAATNVILRGLELNCTNSVPALEIADAGGAAESTYEACIFSTDGDYAVTPAAGITTIGGIWRGCSSRKGLVANCGATGSFENCTGGDYSFGGGVDAGVASGTFVDCAAGDCSFGYSEESDATFSGTAIRCTAGEYSFGSCNETDSTYKGTCSGTLTDCTASGYSFGWGSGTSTTNTCSAMMVRCTCLGLESFGWGGTAGEISSTAILTDCVAPDQSFGSTSCQGVLTRCVSLERTDSILADGNSKYSDCTFTTMNDAAVPVVYVLGAAVPVLSRCTLISGDGITASVASAADEDLYMDYCRLNVDIDATVTNLIGGGFNIVDSNVQSLINPLPT